MRRTTSTCRPIGVSTVFNGCVKYPNVLISRTFSKAYGLAGLRVGYGVAQPELTDLLNRVRQPFNVNAVAQAAAVAALGDTEFIEEGYQLNRDGLQQLGQAFRCAAIWNSCRVTETSCW